MNHPVDYSKFERSLARLREQHANWHQNHSHRMTMDREAVIESVIHRFEVCYDCLWKVLKRHLRRREFGLDMDRLSNSPNPTFRLAHENGLLPGTMASWLRYNDARNDTSHDYDGDKAQACLALVPGFINDAVCLHARMTGRDLDGVAHLAVSEQQRIRLVTLLNRYLPNVTSWVYGSRTGLHARDYSDLDIVVFAGPDQSDAVTELREAFDDSDLPFRVDLFVWDQLSESFREWIHLDHVVLTSNPAPIA